MMGQPLTDAHRKLNLLVGRWKGPEKCHPSPWDPNGGPALGQVENRLTCSGFAVVQEYRQQRDGHPNFEGHGVFRWDSQEGCYLLHWYDSGGLPASVFRGQFEGHTLAMICDLPEGKLRCRWEVAGNRNKFCMEAGDGTHWQPLLEGEYSRED